MKPILFQLLSHNNMENAPAAGAADNQNPIGHAPAASSSSSRAPGVPSSLSQAPAETP